MIELPERFSMGDNQRFHIRTCSYIDYKWQVYTPQFAYCVGCDTEEQAKITAEALEQYFNKLERSKETHFGL